MNPTDYLGNQRCDKDIEILYPVGAMSRLTGDASTPVVINTPNFSVGMYGDGHIHYSVDSAGTVMVYSTDSITLNLDNGLHTVDAWLVDTSHSSLDPAVSASTTFTVDVAPACSVVGDINDDGYLNIMDVVQLVNLVLEL